MEQISITDIAIVPLIAAVLEAVKRSVPLEIIHQLAPLISMLLGVVVGLGVYGVSFNSVLIGVAYGLSASGLYSGIRSTKKRLKGE